MDAPQERPSLEDLKAQADAGGCPTCGCQHIVKTDDGMVCRHCGKIRGRLSAGSVSTKGAVGVLKRRQGVRGLLNSFPLAGRRRQKRR